MSEAVYPGMTRGARPSGRCVRSGRRGRAGRDARSCSRSAVRTPACAWARPLRRLAGLPRNAIIFRKALGKGAFSSLLKLTQAFGGGKALLPAPPPGTAGPWKLGTPVWSVCGRPAPGWFSRRARCGVSADSVTNRKVCDAIFLGLWWRFLFFFFFP